MATGDVTVRLDPAARGEEADMEALQRKFSAWARGEAKGATTFDAERLAAIERQREAAQKPIPEPWDAWRQQKAPEMFEPEVTQRG